MGMSSIGVLAYADDIILLCPSINSLKKMIKICEEFAKEYQLTFNSNKSYCIQFGDRPVGNKTVLMNVEPMEWVSEVKHLGNILSSNLSDKNYVIYKKG